jgi:hypothetical protein
LLPIWQCAAQRAWAKCSHSNSKRRRWTRPAHIAASDLAAEADPAAIELPDEEYERTRALVETLMGRRPELHFEYVQKMPASPAISTFKDHLRKSAAALN